MRWIRWGTALFVAGLLAQTGLQQFNFDTTAVGTRLTTQLTTVLFPDGAFVRRASDLGISAGSLPHVLQKDCTGIEFDTAPMRLQFPTGQGVVRVNVGNPESGAVTAILRAFNATTGGTQVGQTSISLPARAPAIYPLEICRATQRDIRRVEITLGQASCEVIDNLAFDSAPELGTPTLVNFDDRTNSTRIQTQYLNLNFIDRPWIRTASLLGLTTASSPNVLEQYSFGLEFDSPPLRFTLTQPQAYVRVRVGSRGGTRTILMRAYNQESGGIPVSSSSVTVTSPSVTTPIEACRLIDRDIRRIEIEDPSQDFEVIDNLEYGGASSSAPPPPPPPTDTQAPTAFFDAPVNGALLTNPNITVRGRITENRGLERVFVYQEPLDGGTPIERDILALGFVRGTAPNFTFEFPTVLSRGRTRFRIEVRDTATLAGAAQTQVTLADVPRLTFVTPEASAVQIFASLSYRVRLETTAFAPDISSFRLTTRTADGRIRGATTSSNVAEGTGQTLFLGFVMLLGGDINERNTLVAEYTTPDGLVLRAERPVWYSRPDLRVGGMEVVQAIESASSLTLTEGSTVPLVANKRTAVRVFPAMARWFGNQDAPAGGVELFGRRGGVELPGAPLRLTDRRTVRQEFPVTALREDNSAVWNFLLPDEWTREGELELTARITAPAEPNVECDRCTGNNEFRRSRIRFQTRNPLTIQPVLVSVGGSAFPDASTIGPSLAGAQRLYPTASFNILPARNQVVRDPSMLDTDDRIAALADRMASLFTCHGGGWWGWFTGYISGCRWTTHVYGLVDPATARPARFGCAVSAPGPAAWGIAGAGLASATHEIGHLLGRGHAGGHGEGGVDSRFPGRHGEVLETGFDPVTMNPVNGYPSPVSGWASWMPVLCYMWPGCTSDARHLHDFMSYGEDPHWISAYTWRGIFDRNFQGGLASERMIGEDEPSRRFVGIEGLISPEGQWRVSRIHMATLPNGVGVSPPGGTYRFDAVDASGRALYTFPFEPELVTETDPQRPWRKFRAVVPFPLAAARLLLRDPAGTTILERAPSNNAPAVRVVSPNGGESWPASGNARVTWTASDADGDPLTFTVQVSPDNGTTWNLVAEGVTETGVDVPLAGLPGGAQARVRVVANDGFRTASDESDAPFRMAAKAPQVIILAPENRSLVDPAQFVAFEGTASDPEDGMLPGASIRWTSDRDGILGTGARLDVSRLTAGVHRIRAAARDRDGNEGEAIVTITVPGTQIAHASAADFRRDALTADMLVSAFGTDLAASVVQAERVPLPETLGNVRVTVRDSAGVERPASLVVVTPTQINYVLPPGLALGAATVNVLTSRSLLLQSQVLIDRVSPGIFTANASGTGAPAALVTRAFASGAQATDLAAEYSTQTRQFAAKPIDLGGEGDQVFLILFGTGIRNRTDLARVRATVGGLNAPVLYAGPAPGYPGLDQVNLLLPRALAGRGTVGVGLDVDGVGSNRVEIAVK